MVSRVQSPNHGYPATTAGPATTNWSAAMARRRCRALGQVRAGPGPHLEGLPRPEIPAEPPPVEQVLAVAQAPGGLLPVAHPAIPCRAGRVEPRPPDPIPPLEHA